MGPAARKTLRAGDWYVWSDTDTGYGTPSRNLNDRHRFFNHQPDLNYDIPAVREEMWNVMKFWLELGVDGFRLDAVPYLVERENTMSYGENWTNNFPARCSWRKPIYWFRLRRI
jgi:maltose alpha-D-glucosyltransferase/alpha-amylase